MYISILQNKDSNQYPYGQKQQSFVLPIGKLKKMHDNRVDHKLGIHWWLYMSVALKS